MDTICVKIAVCVAPDGTWYAMGSSEMRDEDAFSMAEEITDRDFVEKLWITADIPVPKPQAIETVKAVRTE